MGPQDWVGEEHGAAIDTGDLSHVATLLVRYRVRGPAPAYGDGRLSTYSLYYTIGYEASAGRRGGR